MKLWNDIRRKKCAQSVRATSCWRISRKVRRLSIDYADHVRLSSGLPTSTIHICFLFESSIASYLPFQADWELVLDASKEIARARAHNSSPNSFNRLEEDINASEWSERAGATGRACAVKKKQQLESLKRRQLKKEDNTSLMLFLACAGAVADRGPISVDAVR